jgi:hypothetical protein
MKLRVIAFLVLLYSLNLKSKFTFKNDKSHF